MSWSARDEAGAREFFDSEQELSHKVKKVAHLLRSSKHAIIFTGAGLSTSAGIPDFRSGLKTVLKTGPGLWAAQADYEKSNPVRNEFTRNDPKRPKVDLDKFIYMGPTYAHKCVSALVRENLVKTVMTQNVDNLHRKSGVKRKDLIELHGNLQCEKCDTCGAEFERDFRIGPNPGNNHYTNRKCEMPNCPGWLKDYLVPFGEDLPKKETDRAWRESEIADFCLVLGSSMTTSLIINVYRVTPACDYAGWVGRKTKREWQNPPEEKGDLCIINIQKTPYDNDASCVMHGFCDSVMKLLMEELEISV